MVPPQGHIDLINKECATPDPDPRYEGVVIDPLLMRAFAEIESSWNPAAIRYEPAYTYLVPFDSLDPVTETFTQKLSYGYFQLMGANARGLSFKGTLFNLLDPAINIHYACLFMRRKFSKYDAVQDRIASYNAGSPRKTISGQFVNQGYVDKVMKAYKRLGGV